MLSRRDFLHSTLVLHAARPRQVFAGAALQNARFPTSLFTLGVASVESGRPGAQLQ